MNKIIVSLMLSAVLIGCSGSDDGASKASQVVAQVNGDEISVHQLNLELAKAGNLTPEQSKVVAKQVLDKLVTQQLLVQKAKEAKLDRNPKVLQILEASKAQLLAQAYLEKVGSGAAAATANEIDQFYNEHPELFSDRRIFRLREIVVAAKPEQFDTIVAKVGEFTTLDSILNWLKEDNYKFTVNQSTKAAEQLGKNVLMAIQPMKDGGVVPIKTDKTVNIIAVAAYKEAPIDKEKAKPFIEQYFKNKNKSELLKAEIENLKKHAELKYLGEFALSDKAGNENKGTKEVTEPKPASKDKKSVLDKGIEGL